MSTAILVISTAAYFHPEFDAQRYQVYLLSVFLTIVSTLIVCLLPKTLGIIEKVCFWVSVLGAVVVTITMLAASGSKQSARTVFVEYKNQSGWDDGLSFLLAVGSAMFSFTGTDGATHLAEVSGISSLAQGNDRRVLIKTHFRRFPIPVATSRA